VKIVISEWNHDVHLLILSEGCPRYDYFGCRQVWYQYMDLEDGAIREFAVDSQMWQHAELVA
jgi:hypothetical protein